MSSAYAYAWGRRLWADAAQRAFVGALQFAPDTPFAGQWVPQPPATERDWAFAGTDPDDWRPGQYEGMPGVAGGVE